MVLLKDEHMEACKEFEQAFRWAINSNFVGLKTSEFQRVMNIYTEVFGESLNTQQMSCNTCRLKALKKIAQAYFDTKSVDEENARRKLLQASGQTQVQETKKKPGRPKKLQ